MSDAAVNDSPQYETTLSNGSLTDDGVAPTVISALPPPVFANLHFFTGDEYSESKAAIISDVPLNYFGNVPVYLVDGSVSTLVETAGVDSGGNNYNQLPQANPVLL